MEDKKTRKTIAIHTGLFLLTFVVTTIAGAEWIFNKSLFYGEELLGWSEIMAGLYYSIPFLGILTAHEFGHYFTAKYYKTEVTLPYYIPLWFGFAPLFPSFGTMGAFIRIKSMIKSRKEYFDIGVAGPIAGFVVALFVLTYGFTHLPEPSYIFEIHPEYEQYGVDYEDYAYEHNEGNFVVGDNLLFLFFKKYVADPERVPNNYELYHYPWLFAGYLALFFTALNLIPIGQLDGGHVIYGLLGYKYSRIVSRTLFLVMVTISGISFVPRGIIDIDFLVRRLFIYFFFSWPSFTLSGRLRKGFC